MGVVYRLGLGGVECRRLLPALLLALSHAPTASGQGGPVPVTVYADPDFDVGVRRTDAGASAPFDADDHNLPNICRIAIGRWEPPAPSIDLFAGNYVNSGGFARLDVVFEGLINPPGSTDPYYFHPFAYGPNPVYGFIELDVDVDETTGGEVDAPGYRYLANIARFGGIPEGAEFTDRVAGESADLDGDFTTPPYVERSGEEFHLALLGGQFTDQDVEVVVGDTDLEFDSGETWDIVARWLHRAHGFEPFSLATGGTMPGEYELAAALRFSHDAVENRTTMSLVFPLNNGAAAAMWNEPPQAYDHDPSDQASILEALHDLRDSAIIVDMFPTGQPEETLIIGWKDRGPGAFINAQNWRLTALVGTTYSSAGHGFVWTDVFPNVLRGDVDGHSGVDFTDRWQIETYIAAHDGDDGSLDGRLCIAGFAADFAVYDVNHDGVVEPLDVLLASAVADADDDGDVDLADFGMIQQCFGNVAADWPANCPLVDLNGDGAVTVRDYRWFQAVLSGPRVP